MNKNILEIEIIRVKIKFGQKMYVNFVKLSNLIPKIWVSVKRSIAALRPMRKSESA